MKTLLNKIYKVVKNVFYIENNGFNSDNSILKNIIPVFSKIYEKLSENDTEYTSLYSIFKDGNLEKIREELAKKINDTKYKPSNNLESVLNDDYSQKNAKDIEKVISEIKGFFLLGFKNEEFTNKLISSLKSYFKSKLNNIDPQENLISWYVYSDIITMKDKDLFNFYQPKVNLIKETLNYQLINEIEKGYKEEFDEEIKITNIQNIEEQNKVIDLINQIKLNQNNSEKVKEILQKIKPIADKNKDKRQGTTINVSDLLSLLDNQLNIDNLIPTAATI